MSEQNKKKPSEELFNEHKLDALPLTLNCRLAQLQTTTGELKRLSQGMILPLKSASLDDIILCNERNLVASASLMQLSEGGLALRINEILMNFDEAMHQTQEQNIEEEIQEETTQEETQEEQEEQEEEDE